MKMRYLILCALFLISGIQIYAQSELTVITFNIKSVSVFTTDYYSIFYR